MRLVLVLEGRLVGCVPLLEGVCCMPICAPSLWRQGTFILGCSSGIFVSSFLMCGGWLESLWMYVGGLLSFLKDLKEPFSRLSVMLRKSV